MTCSTPERIPLNCPQCQLHIGYYIRVYSATYIMLGFDLTQRIESGQCLCGYRFVDFGIPKMSWEKLARRYYERMDNETKTD